MVDKYNNKHNSAVKAWECVKRIRKVDRKVSLSLTFNPHFADHEKYDYIFAIGVLLDEQDGAHKPVFPGDTLYTNYGEPSVIPEVAADSTLLRPALDRMLGSGVVTWHPKKATFELNGETLPCPQGQGHVPLSEPSQVFGINLQRQYWYHSEEDREAARKALGKLLSSIERGL